MSSYTTGTHRSLSDAELEAVNGGSIIDAIGRAVRSFGSSMDEAKAESQIFQFLQSSVSNSIGH